MAKQATRILKDQSFTLALLGAIAAAILFPDLGLNGGPLKTEITTKLAVSLIFLIQGLSLPTRQIAASVAKFRLHAFCQISIFLAAPALMIVFLLVFGNWIHPGIKAGFFYLSALPTTISSAIVMTTNSDGDSSAALFSTVLSNVLGIVVTPLLCAFLIASSIESGPSLSSLISKLALLVLLPLLVGQLIRPFVRNWILDSKKRFKRLSNFFIVFIVFSAFCQSVDSGIWGQVGAAAIATALLLSLLFLLLFSSLVWLASPLASRHPAERIAAFFCGSHKTLATGVPMASILFASLPPDSSLSIGLIILPLMCYHPLQLFLSGALSPYLKKFARSA